MVVVRGTDRHDERDRHLSAGVPSLEVVRARGTSGLAATRTQVWTDIDANRYSKNTPLRSCPVTAPTTRDGWAGSEVN